jgi:uncharacterized protein YbgA (DUF1722 family)/uncharacterized protein YbbK (DUF523 family)
MSGRVERDEPIWVKWHDESIPIRLGVSACLLGGEVRYDGGHKRDRYLTDVLGENVDWLPVCPEIEVGMGIPRPVIQLRGGEIGESLVERESDVDWTDRMRVYADSRAAELARLGLDGFVLKKGSPSCGMTRVRVYGHPGGMPSRNGVGHFAQALTRGMPDLPVEEEGRLRDAVLRERFIEEIFSHNRWRVLVSRGLTRGRLVAFHEAHKMLILAHDQKIYREMGRVVASFGQVPDNEVYAAYHPLFVAAFRKTATIARHVNVLEHLFGHVKDKISKAEKREISASIDDYRSARIPLVVVISLLRFMVAAHDVTYVRGQLYLEPHPRELMLRNHV